MVKNAILIPAKGIKIQTDSDDDDDENENSSNKYSKSKPQYMTFKKACDEEPSLSDLRRYSNNVNCSCVWGSPYPSPCRIID